MSKYADALKEIEVARVSSETPILVRERKPPGFWGNPVKERKVLLAFIYGGILIVLLAGVLGVFFLLGGESVFLRAGSDVLEVGLAESMREPDRLRKVSSSDLTDGGTNRGVPDQFYTIQLVTYGEEERAEAQIQKLIRQGYQPFLSADRRYYRVCLEKFSEKTHALVRLSEVRDDFGDSAFQDAFVRLIQQ